MGCNTPGIESVNAGGANEMNMPVITGNPIMMALLKSKILFSAPINCSPDASCVLITYNSILPKTTPGI